MARYNFLLETGCDVSFRDADEDAQSGDAATAVDVVSDSFPQGKLMAKARTPDNGRTRINGITLDDLRENMGEAVQRSCLSLADVGYRMGFKGDRRAVKNAVWYLMNRCDDPGIVTLQNLAAATGVALYELFRSRSRVEPVALARPEEGPADEH